MGYVELLESIKRITSIPIPEDASLVFSACLGGLTFGDIVLTAVGRNNRELKWKLQSVPTSEQLHQYSVEIHKMAALPPIRGGK